MIKKKRGPIERGLEEIARREARLMEQASRYHAAKWKEALEQKIPPKVYEDLQKTFCRAFGLIFEKGTGLIEKTYSRSDLEKDFQIRDFAIDLKGGKKELHQLKAEAGRGNLVNLTISTVEGIGLGILGIGLPDIVLFLSLILKGTYETAIRYGFSYDDPEERMYILKLLEAAMSKGERWAACNAGVDSYLSGCGPQERTFSEQIQATADAFAADMLLAKSIQGIPVAGIVGGLGNPVYYRRILYYVQLKYQKRYLQQKVEKISR